MRTVQGDLENALSRILTTEAQINCAGRTDAGVHALGQVINVPDVPEAVDPARLMSSLNTICGPSIALHRVAEVPEDWHARFDARSRTYVYAVLEGETPDPFRSAVTWHHRGRLNVDVMNEAAGHLVGEHDFLSFGRLPDADASSVRTLFELRAERSERTVRITARANAFIQQMVRSLAGTLVEVGAGRRDPAQMPRVLAARDRSVAGIVAPPHGLCLVAVEYDAGWSPPPTV